MRIIAHQNLPVTTGYKCQDKHNTCLCDAGVKPNHGMTTTVAEDSSMVAMVGKALSGGEPVMLKTAIVSLSNISDENCCKERVLFDDASSRSYITQQLCNDLKLKPLAKRQVIIKDACATSTTTECNDMQLKVKTSDPQVQIVLTTSVLKEICHPIEGQVMEVTKNNYPHLKGIYVNDLLTNNKHLKTINILIAADFYYEFMTGVTKRPSMGRGPVATLKIVGWVVGGPLTSELENETNCSTTSGAFKLCHLKSIHGNS